MKVLAVKVAKGKTRQSLFGLENKVERVGGGCRNSIVLILWFLSLCDMSVIRVFNYSILIVNVCVMITIIEI